MQSSLRHQRVLSRFGAHAVAEADLDALLRQAAACLAEGLDLPRAKVLRYRPESDDLLMVAGVGWHDGVVGRAVVPNDPDTPAGRVLATREPVAAEDLRRPGALRPNHLLAEHGVVAALNAPIGGDGAPWGVLEADGGEPRAFRETDVLFVQSFAHLLAAAIRRSEAEASARRSRVQLDAVLDQLPLGVSVAEAPSGRLILSNAKGTDLLGHPMLATGSIGDYAQYGALHPDGTPYRPEEYPMVRAVLHGENVEQEPMLYRRGDGRLTHLLITAAPVRDAAGRILLGVTIAQDVDERFRMEAELRRQQQAQAESEARYRAAFEQAAVGIAETAPDGRILRANDRFCTIVGYGRDELMRLRFQDITHPDDLPTGVALTAQLYAGAVASFVQEKRYLRKDGGTVWASLSCSAVPDATGRPAYVLAVIEDISARKQAEDEREELMRRQDLLMREMNHRIKNSLQMVALLVHMQAADIVDPDTRARFEETATRIATVALVHRRLYSSSGLETVESAPYLRDLGEDIGNALGLDERLTVEAVDEVLPADTAIALGLMVNELVTNAAKYAYPAGRSGPVRVVFDRTAESRLRLTVSDEGIGLPAGFEPGASAGLGMRVLVALADKAGATLHVAAGGPGTRFEVVLGA